MQPPIAGKGGLRSPNIATGRVILGLIHQQPAEDPTVLGLDTTEMPLEWVEYLIYLARDACATPHVSRSCRFWDVGDIQNTQKHFFFQGFSRVGSCLEGVFTRHF